MLKKSLSRHLKSHNFYACSTCVLRLSNSEEIERHVGQHVKACLKKGCKRTKKADLCSNGTDCAHIMTAEDQWRELFVLQFSREPPNVFATESRTQSHVINASVSSNPIVETPLGFGNDLGNYGLTNSFFDQAMDYDLGLTITGTDPVIPALHINEFIIPDPPQAHHLLKTDDTKAGAQGAISTPPASPLPRNQATNAGDSISDVVATLQSQVNALENMLSTQRNKEKDQLSSLQERNVQLEQRLYQSSEREQQLEATLGVIFDALQATGAPPAQPNKALWRLVMSHSSQAVGSVSTVAEKNESKTERVSSNSFISMSPSLSFATSSKITAQTPPDSTYGSVR